MKGYRFVNLERGEIGLFRINHGALEERPLLRGTAVEMERELGLLPGTLRPLGQQRITGLEVLAFVLAFALAWLACWGLL